MFAGLFSIHRTKWFRCRSLPPCVMMWSSERCRCSLKPATPRCTLWPGFFHKFPSSLALCFNEYGSTPRGSAVKDEKYQQFHVNLKYGVIHMLNYNTRTAYWNEKVTLHSFWHKLFHPILPYKWKTLLHLFVNLKKDKTVVIIEIYKTYLQTKL
jgi:hypothetical protein